MRLPGLHPATWVFALALGALATGCTENFGTPPLDPSGRIAVPAEEPAGPPPFSVAAQSLAGTDEQLWLGLERGLYHVLPGSWRWWPGHAGFTPDSPTTPRAIRMVQVDPSGRVSIHVSPLGTIDVLFASVDRGATFRELEIPNLIAGTVDAVAALAPSDVHPDGAFLAAQGAAIYVRDLAGDWTRAMLPDTPRTVRAAASGEGGHFVVGVEGQDGSPYAWISSDGGRNFVDAGLALTADVLDVAVSGDGEIAVATRNEVVGPAARIVPSSEFFTRADLRFVGSQLRYACLTTRSILQTGRVEPASTPVETDAPSGTVALLVTETEVYLTANPRAELWRLVGAELVSHEFDGRSLAMTAVAADPRSPGSIYLGHFSGEVFFGDPAEMLIGLDGPQNPALSRALLPDTGSSAGVFNGNFGVQLIESNILGAPWLDRSAGQFNLTPDVFAGPVGVQELAVGPTSGQHLWLGSDLGNGPYESLNGGLLWVRVDGGLGVPPPFAGFPAVTQVRAFAFADDETWMGSFLGGVWSLSESTRAWEQSNRGLPDINGAIVDTCCFDPPDPDDIFAPTPTEVDVRDLVVLENGALLAATGWGIYRDERREGDWQESVGGLTNSDIFALALHPDRPQWVVAAARGSADNADWLFLSRDGGMNWNPIDSRLRARFAEDVVWSDPASLELTAILSGSGAWRLEIAP